MKRMVMLILLAIVAGYSATPVATHGRLQVSGAHVVGEQGEVVALRGMSLFWSQWSGPFYNHAVVDWLVKDWKIDLIRIAVGVDGTTSGYLVDADTQKERIDTVVQAAVDNGIYVIIDWHDHTASAHTDEAKAFFAEMAQKYGALPNVVWEIWNEPLDGANWLTDIKPYAESVIPSIRKYDTDNLIVVGTRNWSQRVDEVIGHTLQDVNVAYTLHFYVGSHGQALRDIADQAIAAGLPLFVTEWGIWDAGYVRGDYTNPVDVEQTMAWLDWVENRQLCSAMWSVNDKDEPSAIVFNGTDARGGWGAADLTTAGSFMREYFRGKSDGTWVVPEQPVVAPDTIALPGRLEAESYADAKGIQVEKSQDDDGTRNIGYIENGDYATYMVRVAKADTYPVVVRHASEGIEGVLVLSVDGVEKSRWNIAVTGGWQIWADAYGSVELPAGLHELRLDFVGESGSALYNLNYLDIGGLAPLQPNSMKASAFRIPAGSRFDLLGRYTNWVK